MDQVTYESYLNLIKHISEAYRVTFVVEHKFIHEFYEGKIPLFKLIFAYDEKAHVNKLLLTFHLELDSVDAVQWFLRFNSAHANLRLTECYYKDDRGETFMGQDAEVLLRYKTEQAVLSNWASDKTEAEKYAKEPIYGRAEKRKQKAYLDRTAAVKEFLSMKTGKDEDQH